MKHEYAVLCPQGGTAALAAELQTWGIHATPGGADWLRAALTDEQCQHIADCSQATTQLLRILVQGARSAIEEYATRAPALTGSFAVRADGEDRQELQEHIGGLIKDATGASVNLNKPDTLFYIHEADGELLLGIDVAGPLGKRHYKIITGAQSLTGPVAYSVLRLAGWDPRRDLVVWPAGTGELAIEAALAATGRSPRAYERKRLEQHEPSCAIVCADPKLSLVRSAEKNAKVAGVHSAIRYSRQDADWLDTKYEEHGVPLLVGLLPNLKLQPKLVKEIYYQLDYILKPGGSASFLCVNDDSASLLETGEKGYAPSRIYIWSGKHCFTLVSLRRETQRTKKKTASPSHD